MIIQETLIWANQPESCGRKFPGHAGEGFDRKVTTFVAIEPPNEENALGITLLQ